MTKLNKSHIFCICILILSFYSCRSTKTLYNPKEVSELSARLKVPINNDDPNMALYVESAAWLNTPYRYGGTTRAGLDCSGLTGIIFQKVYGKTLERSSEGIANKNVKKVSKNKLTTGDLVFFATSSKKNKISHVGIMLNPKQFIHASTSRGVIVSNLDEDYYKRAFVKGGRVK